MSKRNKKKAMFSLTRMADAGPPEASSRPKRVWIQRGQIQRAAEFLAQRRGTNDVAGEERSIRDLIALILRDDGRLASRGGGGGVTILVEHREEEGELELEVLVDPAFGAERVRFDDYLTGEPDMTAEEEAELDAVEDVDTEAADAGLRKAYRDWQEPNA